MDIERDGYTLIRKVLDTAEVASLSAALAHIAPERLRGGVRNIERCEPAVATLARSEKILALVRPYLPNEPQLVRAIYFVKSSENNWLVTWHQDRTVAVSGRFEAEGWGPWSLKADVWHVQPPLEVLESMVTIRLHLDDTGRDNGCLKVVPGSHRNGVLDTKAIVDETWSDTAAYCEAARGDALLMRPHLLHASEKSAPGKQRRVLHFEYSGLRLPAGINWAA